MEACRESLTQLLQGWSPDQHEDLAEMLNRLARTLMTDEGARRVFTNPRQPDEPAT